MSKYDYPMAISYAWNCPVHNVHHRTVALASKPKADEVIANNTCTLGLPNDPVYLTELYGDLTLKANQVVTK